MPLQFMESFDHISTLTGNEKWQQFNPPATISVGAGRNGSNAANNATSGTLMDQSINTPQSTVWLLVGCAIKNRGNASDGIIWWKDYNGTILGFVVLNLSGAMSVWTGINTTLGTRLGTTRARLWHFDEWVYVEARIHFDASAGSAYIYVNGKEELAVVGQPTFTSATLPWRQVSFFCNGEIEDVYAASEGGVVDAAAINVGNNPGDVHIENLMAVPDSTAAGFYQDFTPLSGLDHGAMVDENLPGNDGDTTYNLAIDPEDIDTYRYEAISSITTGTIYGVQFNPTMRKDAIGTRIVRNLIRVSGINYANAPIGLSSDYLDNWEAREINPNTAVAWTIPEVDAIEWGVNLQVATDGAPPDEGGPAPGAGQPPPDGAAPGGDSTGAPSSATFLPIIQAYAAANPAQLANSCQPPYGSGTWDFMDGVLADLRAADSRWGYNGKRGNLNDPSPDAFAYYAGPGDPYDGALNTYVIDIIGGHCGASPSPQFLDQTRPNILGAWLTNR